MAQVPTPTEPREADAKAADNNLPAQPSKLVGSFTRREHHGTLASATGGSSNGSHHHHLREHEHDVLSHCCKKDFFFSREPIGKGAYGVVYKAVDQRSGQTVAIKQLKVEGKTSNRWKL